MPLLKDEADKLSNDMLRQGVIENIITSDEVFALLPFIPISGKAYVYNREASLGTAAFVDVNEEITESASTFTKVTETLRRIIGDVDVDDFLQTQESDTTDQSAVQIGTKSKVVGRSFANKLINGDSTGTAGKEFDGLLNLMPAGQMADTGDNGGALSFDFLDEMIDLVKVGGQRVYIMPSRTLRAYIQLVRALGGTNPEHLTVEGITGPIPSYRGIPILKNDWIPVNQTKGTGSDQTTIFLAALDEAEGLAGLMSDSQGGVEVKVVGPVQNKDATRYRVRWYTSVALHSELSVAAADGITN
jgi:HK97 family phage major capsid protein